RCYRQLVSFPLIKERPIPSPSRYHSNVGVHLITDRQATPSASKRPGNRGNSCSRRQPDRNPLYAAADPPAFGRCPTARGPSVGPSRQPSDRPRVLFSVLCQPLGKSNERADRGTLWAFGSMRAIAVEPEGAGDVEVRPLRAVLD